MDRIDELMKELNEAHRKKDYADMGNIIKLELLDLIKEKASENE